MADYTDDVKDLVQRLDFCTPSLIDEVKTLAGKLNAPYNIYISYNFRRLKMYVSHRNNILMNYAYSRSSKKSKADEYPKYHFIYIHPAYEKYQIRYISIDDHIIKERYWKYVRRFNGVKNGQWMPYYTDEI